MASPSALAQVPTDSSNYQWLVTKLFKGPEICVIASEASGTVQVPNKSQYSSLPVQLQNLWEQNSSFKSKLGCYTWEQIKTRTYKTNFDNVS